MFCESDRAVDVVSFAFFVQNNRAAWANVGFTWGSTYPVTPSTEADLALLEIVLLNQWQLQGASGTLCSTDAGGEVNMNVLLSLVIKQYRMGLW